MGSEKETRFLGFWGWLVGQRNRVSAVGIKSYLWEAGKKPGFWGSGFLGGGCWGKETGFLLLILGVICGLRERNPVSGVFPPSQGNLLGAMQSWVEEMI